LIKAVLIVDYGEGPLPFSTLSIVEVEALI